MKLGHEQDLHIAIATGGVYRRPRDFEYHCRDITAAGINPAARHVVAAGAYKYC